MSGALPAFYNSLDRSLERAWLLIAEGAANRDSPCHTPVFATIGADGQPAQRILVLRAFDRDAETLRFHTDARSNKIGEIGVQPSCALLLYDADARIQLRLRGTVRVESDSAVAEQAWQSADAYSRRCYLADPAPGTPIALPASGLPPELEGTKPNEHQLEPARGNFAVLTVRVDAIDFLYLAHQGHRRAQFERSADGWTGQWLVP